MKTSNKIFIAFLIFLLSGITALYIGSKYYVEYYDTHNFVNQEKSLPPFSVVVAEPNAQIQLINNPKAKIVQSFFKTAQPKFAPFEVRNDTLFISAAEHDKTKVPRGRFTTEVYCQNVKQFVAKDGSFVNFSGYQVDSIFVNMDNADLACQNNNSIFIKMIAKNSSVNFDCGKLNSMEVKLDKTRLELKSKKRINNISGTLKNDSDMVLSLDGKVNLDVDKSSNLAMYDLHN